MHDEKDYDSEQRKLDKEFEGFAAVLTILLAFMGLSLIALFALIIYSCVNAAELQAKHEAYYENVRKTCPAVDTFLVREAYSRFVAKNQYETRYRIIRYERFRCPNKIETLRTYLMEDNSSAMNAPHDVQVEPDTLDEKTARLLGVPPLSGSFGSVLKLKEMRP